LWMIVLTESWSVSTLASGGLKTFEVRDRKDEIAVGYCGARTSTNLGITGLP
jgi:hypothetical protein